MHESAFHCAGGLHALLCLCALSCCSGYFLVWQRLLSVVRRLLRLPWLRVLRLLPELLRLRLGRLLSALGASLLWRVARALVGGRARLARRRMARSSLTRSSAAVPGVLRHSAHAVLF